MHNKGKNSIVCAGIAGCIGVALLTGFAANIVIEKVNENADKAYAEAMMSVQQQQFLDWKAEQDKLAQIERNESLPEVSTSVTDYTVDDIITIDGEQYVISVVKPTESETENITGDKPEIDDSDTEISDGVTDSDSEENTIQNPESNDNDDMSTDTDDTTNKVDDDAVISIPYFGADNVIFDADGNLVYLVKRGDTLTKVSNLTGYSVQELAEYNHIENINLIYSNQAIRIPASQEIIDYMHSILDSNYSSTESNNSAKVELVPAQ